MNVTRLRAIMHRYKEAGVLLVGAYLVGHHLWTKRRIALLTTPATLLILACWLAGVLKGPDLASKPSVTPSPRVVTAAKPQTRIYRPQQPLLSHASKVLALDEDYSDHCWISTERLLLVTSTKPIPHDNHDIDEGLTAWQGQASLLDLRTGRRRKLAGLTRVFHRMQATPDRFETSPGGEWLKWINYETPDGWPFPAAARLDGSGFQQWDQSKSSETYWLDDHHWVEEETLSYDEAQYPKEVIVHNAERQTKVRLKLHSKAGQKVVRRYYATCEHEFGTSWDSKTTLVPRVKISEWKCSKDQRFEMAPLHTYTVPMPAGSDVRQVLVAPKTGRVLYVLRFHQVAEGIQPQPKYGVFDLWTSRRDGSDLKELGYVETGEPDCSDHIDPMTTQNMIDLEWLPDGKQFSFIYRDHLYRAAGY